MKNYDKLVKLNQNPNWPYILDNLYRILINGGSWSGKSNVLQNLIKKINSQMLTKFIYTLKIHSKQSINYLLMEDKK